MSGRAGHHQTVRGKLNQVAFIYKMLLAKRTFTTCFQRKEKLLKKKNRKYLKQRNHLRL